MRTLGLLLLIFCAAAAYPQKMATGSTTRLQAIVQVQRDKIGANIVKISLLDPSYPVETLRSQISAMGEATKSGVRGVMISDSPIDPRDPSSKAIRATFAIDGLIERTGAWVRVAPIIKSLAGAPGAHALQNVQINFDFERPTALDLGDFESPAVRVTRRMIDQSLEYSVALRTQDPARIDVPDFASPAPAPDQGKSRSQVDWVVLLVAAVGIVAVGALVYCLFLLKPSQRKRTRR